MHHFVTEMCTHVHISGIKWCIVRYGTGALWDLWISLIIFFMFPQTKFNITRTINLHFVCVCVICMCDPFLWTFHPLHHQIFMFTFHQKLFLCFPWLHSLTRVNNTGWPYIKPSYIIDWIRLMASWIHTYKWLSARLQYIQCASIGKTTVLH